jgi:hypothetical protein
MTNKLISMENKEVDGLVFRPKKFGDYIYWRCRVKGRYLFLHRYLYEKIHNVTLPKNRKVIFKNGDYTDFSHENLIEIPPCEIDTEKGTVKRGDTVPCPNYKGYLTFFYNGKVRRVHRIIYEHHYGIELTKDQHINHINFNVTDNRICNLELVTSQQNAQWRQLSPNNTSGYKGVYFHKVTGKYESRICFNQKDICLGTYKDPIDAALAYNVKAQELNEKFDCKYTLNPVDQPEGSNCNLELLKKRLLSGNASGYKGVSFHKRQGKYQSHISFDGRKMYLGSYNDPIEAARAYNAKVQELNEKFGCKVTLNPLD